ncbi:protein Mpe1p [Diutina catenulata]
MSSVVYYQFLHQKTRSVIHFDGTSISVFDLKREIITQNQLGTGVDFNLRLYHSENPALEYELDTDVVPRSSFVLVKRSPSHTRGGRFNNASRYVSGKPRLKRAGGAPVAPVNPVSSQPQPELSEEDRIKQMFENQSNAWASNQDELAQHKMVYYKPAVSATGAARAEDIPPPGYICYRCGKKDHWIKNCPTNTDPNFENKKILRTTGIPKSYLKTIAKDDFDEDKLQKNENGELFDQDGNAILVTEDGDYAIALADSKTWKNYQEKQMNAAAKQQREANEKMVAAAQSEGKAQFLDPLAEEPAIVKPPLVTTPCCPDLASAKKLKNVYYNQLDLEQTLIESDFNCPNCGSEDVFIDSLVPAKEVEAELDEWVAAKHKELGLVDNKRSLEDSDEPEAKRAKPEFVNQMPFMPFPMFMPPPPPFQK